MRMQRDVHEWFAGKRKSSVLRHVLIACHPMPFEDHWQETQLRNEFKEVFPEDTIVFETTDIGGNPTYKGDLFGDLISRKPELKGKFDAIVLPDCNGLWYDMFETYSKIGSVDQLKEDIINVFIRLQAFVKDNGYIYVSKLLLESNDKIKEFNARIISLFGSLMDFKKDWIMPDWDARYLVYQKSQLGLAARAWFHFYETRFRE